MAPFTQDIVDTGKRAFDAGLAIAQIAVWADDPVNQIAANLVIIVAAMLSSAVTWLVGLGIAAFSLVLLSVGVVRLALQLYRGER